MRAPCLCRRNHSGRSLYKFLSSRSCRSRLAHNQWKRLYWPQGHTLHFVDLRRIQLIGSMYREVKMSRISKTEMECSCASKRLKMNARATSWVTMKLFCPTTQPLSQTCALHSQSLALHKLQTHTLPLRMCRSTVHVQTILTSQTNTKITKNTAVFLMSVSLETELWEADC